VVFVDVGGVFSVDQLEAERVGEEVVGVAELDGVVEAGEMRVAELELEAGERVLQLGCRGRSDDGDDNTGLPAHPVGRDLCGCVTNLVGNRLDLTGGGEVAFGEEALAPRLDREPSLAAGAGVLAAEDTTYRKSSGRTLKFTTETFMWRPGIRR